MSKKTYKPNHGIEAAEPRLLFSAGLEGVLATHDLGIPSAGVEQAAIEQSIDRPTADASTTPAVESGVELIFVDSDTPEYQQLLDDLLQYPDNTTYQVFELDNSRDGISQVSEILVGYDNVSAVHILSHGTAGAIDLGGATLDSQTLTENAAQVAAWGDALTDSADILVYGCNLAANEAGQSLVNTLASLTGADVAASDDLTGSALFGADWELEYRTGQVETDVAISTEAQQSWANVMAVSVDASSNGSTIDQASVTVSHTTSGTNRLMLVGISMSPSGESVSSVTYNGINLTHVGTQEDGAAKARVEIWSLVAPDTGTHDVVVNFTDLGHKGASVGVMTFTGVDQTTALGAFSGNSGLSASASTTVASATDDLVFGVVAVEKGTAVTPGAGQTEYWDIDVNANNGAGTIEAGAASVTTSWTNDLKNWSAAAVSVQAETVTATVLDQFNTVGSYAGNDGTQNWTGDWQELGESNGPSSGNVRVVSSPDALGIGSNGLINGDGALREVDLSQATSATLSFDAWRSGSRAATITLAVSDNGGTSWTNLQTWSFSSLTSSPSLKTFDISAYTSANTQIRFLGSGEADSAYFYADNILIEYTTGDVTAPVQINNTGSTVAEGGTDTISNTELRYDDYLQPATSVTYTVTTATANGWLELTTSPGVGISSFTQDDIDNNRVVYVHNGGEASSDSFTFDVDDGQGNSITGQTFSLTVSPVNDAPTFAIGDGTVTTDFGSGEDIGNSVAVQADGKILVAGRSYNGSNFDFALTRYNADGSLDTSFDGDGRLTTDFGPGDDHSLSISVQADGKILAVGYSFNGSNYDFALVRYNTDGSLDTSFSGDGMLTTAIGATGDIGYSATLQADGKILVSGYSVAGLDKDFALVRYNTDGSLDTSFSGDGMLTTDFGSNEDIGYSVTLQADGKILVAGASQNGGFNDFALARYNTDGSLDTSFSGDGMLTTAIGASAEVGYNVNVQPDGKILLAGYSHNGVDVDFALVRYNTDGTLDTSFSGDGKLTTDFGSGLDSGYDVTLQPDGKILVSGFSSNGSNYDLAVVRYNADGSLDTSFSGDGMLTTAIGAGDDIGQSIVLQPDGKILVAGQSDNGVDKDIALVRYNADGTLDLGFDPVNTLDGAPAFTEGGAPVVLDADVQVFDAELSGADDFSGATLTLVRNGGASGEDLFSATGNLAALTESGSLVLSGVTIGTVTTNSAGTLVLSFNANATQARVNETLQSIAYANSSDAPPASVQVDWDFNDGNSGAQGTGGALSATGSTTVTITAVNDEPVSATNFASGSEDATSIPIILTGSDVDGTVDFFRLSSLPANGTLYTDAGLTITAATATDYAATSEQLLLYFVPNGNWNGVTTFDFAAKDNNGLLDATPSTATLTVNAVNDAPVVNATASDSGTEDTDVVYTHTQLLTLIGATDVDDVDANLSIAISNINNGTLVMSGGSGGAGTTFTFTPTLNFVGNLTFDYQVSDDDSPTPASSVVGTATVALSAVNDAPVTDNVSATGNEDAASIAITLTGSDIDGTVDNFRLDNLPANGTLYLDAGLSIAVATATDYAATAEALTLYFVPDANWNGVTSFQLAARDNGGLLDATPATATITVNADNDTPTTTGVTDVTVNEDTLVTFINLQGSFDDIEDPDTALIYTITNNTNPGLFSSISIGGAGALNMNYAPDQNGTADITVRATDTGGLFAETTFTVTVNPVNDAPVVNATASDTGTEDTDVVYTHAQLLTLVGATDVDDANANLTIAISNINNGTLVMSGGSGGAGTTFTFTPTLNFVGNLTFDYQVSDDESPTPASSAIGTATVALSAVNDAPVVNATASDTGTEDTDVVYTHAQLLTLVGATDVDDANASLSIAISNINNGTLVMSGGSGGAGTTFTFTPTLNFVGNLSFDYQVSDDESPTPATSAIGTATVALSAVNDAPVFNGLDGTPTYIEDGTAVQLDADVTISDIERDALNGGNGDYTASVLTLQRNGGANPEDVFLIPSGGNLTVAGGNIFVGGNLIAGFSNTGGQLSLIFANSGTVPTTALVNEVLQAITYSNSNTGNPPASVQIDYTLNDANSGTQGSGGSGVANGSINVTITPVNDAPTNISLSNSSINENTDTGSGYSVGTLTSTDPDTGDSHGYTVVGGADMGVFSIGGAGSDELVLNDGVLDFESQSSYEVIVRSTDNGSPNLFRDETLTITVNDQVGNISGTIFTDEGVTSIGAGVSISMVVNGVLTETVTTDGAGSYSFNKEAAAGDAVAVFIDNDATHQGITVTVSDGSDLGGIEVYANHIVVRNDNGGVVTIADMDNALGAYADPDIHYAVIGGNLIANAVGSELLVPAGHTFIPGGDVNATSIKILGTVSGGSDTFNIVENWDSAAGSWLSNISSVNLTGTGTINSAGDLFYNLTTGAASQVTTLTSDLTVRGVLTIADSTGTLTDSGAGYDITVTGTGTPFVNNGAAVTAKNFIYRYPSDATIVAAGGTYNVTENLWIAGSGTGSGTTYQLNGDLLVSGGLDVYATSFGVSILDTLGHSITANSLQVSNSAFQVGFLYANNSTIDINGDVDFLNSVTTVVDLGSSDFSVSGNWTNTSNTFSAGTSTVTLDGVNQQLSGSTAFYNLTKVEGSNDGIDSVLTFDNTATQTINGTLTLTGLDADDRINLVSDVPGTQWGLNLTASATHALDYIVVTDSDASASDAGQLTINPANSFSGGNNIGWFGANAGDDAYSVDEGSTTNLNISANDSDGDGLDLTSITITSGPANGSIVINANGTVDYTHDGSETVSDSFTYTIKDSFGEVSNIATVTLTVNPVNDAPAGVPIITGTATEDQVLTADTSGISDADGLGAFSYQWLRNGGVIGGATSSTYTLGDADVGTQISVRVDYIDGNSTAESVTSAQTAAVANINDAPAGTDKTVTTLEDTDYTFTATDFGFTDTADSPANALLAVKITTLPVGGVLYIDANGDGIVDAGEAVSAADTVALADITANQLKFKPAADANGTGYASFTFQVQDDGGIANGGVDLDASPNTITIDVTAQPDAPVAVDDIAYVVDQGGVLTLPADHAFLNTWGTTGTADGQFDNPTGVAIDSDGNVYIVDSNNDRIQKFDSTGAFLISWGSSGSADGEFSNPSRIEVDSAGNMYVTDTGNNRVQVFDSNGNHLLSFGSTGPADGQFSGPRGIVVDSTGNIYVSDQGYHRIQKFDSLGVHILTFGGMGPADGQFFVQDGLAIDGADNLYVADMLHHRIQKFDSAGAHLMSFGSYGTNDGQFSWPQSVAVDTSGNIYVTDQYNHRIQKFDSAGNHVESWGTAGSGNGQFIAPNGIAVNASGNIYVVGGSNDRVQVFSDAGVLVNDFDVDNEPITVYDEDGATPGIQVVSGPGYGILSMNADGSFTYTHDGSPVATDSFTYRVTDGALQSAIATVQININITDYAATTDDVSASGNEDAASIAITLTGSDIEGTVDFYQLSSLPANGTLYTDAGLTTLAATATDYAATAEALTMYFVPTADWNGVTTFQFAAKDNSGFLDATPATATLTVNAVNDAPVANDDTYNVSEGGGGFLPPMGVMLNDTDVDSGSLTAIQVSNVSYGTLTLNANGSWWYTRDPNYNGVDSFTYKVNDGSLDSNIATVTINIAPVNDAPAGSDNTVTTLEDTDYTFTSTDFGFTDPVEGDSFLAVRITTLPAAGTLVLAGSGAVTVGDYISRADIDANKLIFTPAPNANGTGYASFTFQVQDDGGTANGGVDLDQSPNTMTIDVTAVNDAPTATNLDAPETYTEDTSLNLIDIVAGDIDSANVTVTLTLSDATAGSLSTATSGAVTSTFAGGVWSASGAIADVNALLAGVTFTPALDYNSNFTIATSVDDGVAAPVTGLKNITGTPVNDTPTMIFPTAVQNTNEDTPLVFSAANGNLIAVGDVDANGGDMLIDFISYNGTLTLNGTAGLTFTTGDGVADTAMAFTGKIAAINAALDGLFFTPDANFTGGTNFQMWVNDQGNTGAGIPQQTTRAALISVTGVNDVPVATASTVSTTEDNAYTFNVGDFTYTDVEGDALSSVTITNLNLAGGTLQHSGGTTVTNGMTITAAQIASLVYTPAANANGAPLATFDFTVNDSGAGVTAAQMDIDVTPVNDTPVANSDIILAGEDTGQTAGAPGIMANDTDIEGTAGLYVYAVNGVQANVGSTITLASGARLTVNADGSTSYDTNGAFEYLGAGDSANDSFTYTISDAGGLTATTTVTVWITGVNDAPATDNVSASGNEDATSIAITLTGSDVDGTVDNFRLNNLPADGTLYTDAGLTTVAATGVDYAATAETLTLYFVPNADWNGGAGFQYVALDNSGVPDATPATATITVNAVNDAPVVDATASDTGTEDTDQVYTHAQLLTLIGATDVDDTNANLSIAISNVNNGTLVMSGGAGGAGTTFTFTPTANFNGNLTFDYQVSDDDSPTPAGSTVGTATVALAPVNDAPVAVDDSYATNEDGGGFLPPFWGVLVNDTDVDADTLTAILVTPPANGTFTLNPNGSYWWWPDPDYNGTTTFSYKVNDGTTDSNTATVTLTVNPVNDEPVTDDVSVTGNEDAASIAVILTGSDIDSTVDFFQLNGLPPNGTLYTDAGLTTVAATGIDYAATGEALTLYFVPNADWNGTTAFQFAAKDDAGLLDTTPATATITVNAVNDAPVANATASDSGTEDTDVVYTHAELLTLIGATDVDDANADLTISITNINNGTLVMSGGSGGAGTTFTFTPTLNFVGNLTFDYQVSDDASPTPASSAVGTATVALAPVNDAPAGVPVVTGLAQEDQVLTADTGGISDVDGLGAFSYQWLRDGAVITGATAGTYTPGDADVGALISVQVTYTDGYGSSEGPLVSAQTGPVSNVNDAPVGVPVITGLVQEDQVLTADTSGISDVDGLGAFSYQWLRDGAVITGATAGTYTLGDADVGALISVQVTYIDGYGTSEGPLVSTQVGPVANVNDAPLGVVLIDNNTPVEGDILTASNTLTDADGLSGPVSYQWLRDGVAIAGATGSTYTMTSADVGTVISVVASYTDDQGTSESVTSSPTSMVEVILNEDNEPVDTTGSLPAGAADPVPVPVSPVSAPVVGEPVLTAASLDIKDDGEANEETIYKVKPYEFEDYDYRDDSVSNDMVQPVKAMVDMGKEMMMNLSQLIDLVRMQLSESDEQPVNIFVKSVGGITLAISSTVATWFMRGGVIAASMVSSVPVLKGFDPLIMMKKTKDADEEEDTTDNMDDSVDQMFEGTSVKRDLNAGDRQGKS